jgi:hypothetical protein
MARIEKYKVRFSRQATGSKTFNDAGEALEFAAQMIKEGRLEGVDHITIEDVAPPKVISNVRSHGPIVTPMFTTPGRRTG